MVVTSSKQPGQATGLKRENNPTSDRVGYIDVARALGVIGVVLGHAWYGSRAERIALSFDLPLFFFLSGYVYSEKYSSQPLLLGWKRLQTLYKPFVQWGLFWLALHNILLWLNLYSDKPAFPGPPTEWYSPGTFVRMAFRILTFRGTEHMAGALWFLESLFFTNMIFGLLSFLLRKIGRREEWLRAMAVLGLVIAGYFSNPFLRNVYCIGTSLVALSMFYGGLLYRRYEARIWHNWPMAIAAAVLVIASGGGVFIGSNTYENGLLLVTIVPAGIYIVLVLSRALEKSKLLQFIGTNTIFLIGTHFLAFKVVSLAQIWIYGYPRVYLASFPVIGNSGNWWILYFLCGLFLPLGAKYGLDWLIARGKSAPFRAALS